jgi:hypothetical protein
VQHSAATAEGHVIDGGVGRQVHELSLGRRQFFVTEQLAGAESGAIEDDGLG